MRTIHFPVSNPALDEVPFDERWKRITLDEMGRLYLDGELTARYLTESIEVADDATDEQIRQAVEAKAAEMREGK